MRTVLGWLVVVGLALLSGCTAGEGGSEEADGDGSSVASPVLPSPAPSVSAYPTAQSPPGPSAAASPTEATPSPVGEIDLGEVAVVVNATDDVEPADLELVRHFVQFATDPTVAGAELLGLSPEGVRLGLGPTLVQDLDLAAAHDPAAWRIPDQPFRAHTGPYSALTTVDEHVSEPDFAVRLSGDVQVSVGEHRHCASPPVPPPTGLEGLRRVSVQPAMESITTCLAWFTVDLFVDVDGRVVAVTLDLWEP